MNYTDLTQLVVDTIRDTKVPTAQAQAFIAQFEDTLDGDLLDPKFGGDTPRLMLSRVNGTTDSEGIYTVPADLLRPRSVKLNGTPARWVSPEKVPSGVSGFGDSSVEVDYYASVPKLAASTTNWVGDNGYTVYLWGACLQYIPWAHEYENLTAWSAYYTAAIRALKKKLSLRPKGGWISQKGRPFSQGYTIIGNQMRFIGGSRLRGI